jgi:hypothetical protein
MEENRIHRISLLLMIIFIIRYAIRKSKPNEPWDRASLANAHNKDNAVSRPVVLSDRWAFRQESKHSVI